jgi:hypothetical protein
VKTRVQIACDGGIAHPIARPACGFEAAVHDGDSAARDAVADPISGGKVTVKKCHRQQIRRFLTGSTGASNAVSYTKRRCVRRGEPAVDGSLGDETRVPIGGDRTADLEPTRSAGSWHLACSFANPTNRFRDDQRPETLGGRENA